MRQHSATPRQHSVQFEDIVLLILGLIAGPLLWWMSQAWRQNPAASSVETMEYWIALLCGCLGIGLCAMWGIFILAGLGLVIATKTRNRVLTYWSKLFTPKFLQRIIIAVLGIQLTLGSQAYAAEEAPAEFTEVASATGHNPFMPELAEIPATADSDESSSPTASVTNDNDPPSESPTAYQTSDNRAKTEPLGVPPQPRQTSQIKEEVVPETAVSPEGEQSPVSPTPRQTTTIPVPQEPEINAIEQDTTRPGLTKTYTPKKPVPSPYIAAPNPDRSPEGPTLVIQTGDSLWDIAHQELGAGATLAEIDQRWRQWWQHNEDVIGKDPHDLSPGSILEAPPFTH